MAEIIPSDIDPRDIFDAERETLHALIAGLSDDFTIFHNVHWTLAGATRTRYGEIDFIILHRDGRVLLVEQKNGALEEADYGFGKYYGGTRVKSVNDQVQRSLGALREKFSKQHPREKGLFVNCLLYCPDYRVRGVHGRALDWARIVDRVRRDELAKIISAIFTDDDQSGEVKLSSAATVRAFFCQVFDVVPDIATRIGLAETRYTRHAGQLVDLVSNLEFSPFRLRIQGAPGCGKSLLARHWFARQIPAGRRPLYVCFNRRLADEMIASFPDSVDAIYSFHGLCYAAHKAADRSVDFSKNQKEGFWQRLVDGVIELDLPERLQFDALIVDEGQDFLAEWYDVLHLFLVDDYEMLWLEDAHQDVFDRPPVPLPGAVTYRTDTSYRTPVSIAEYIRATLDMAVECGTGLPGMGVGVSRVNDEVELVRGVTATINALRGDGFANEDIVVLTCGILENSYLYRLDSLAGVALTKPGDYDRDGYRRYTEGRLCFDSVLRFKGGQAPAVILVDVEAVEEAWGNTKRLLFCGMTRATVRLDIFIDHKSALSEQLEAGLSFRGGSPSVYA